MNLQSRFDELQNFIQDHHQLISQEVLESDLPSLQAYDQWIEELASLDHDELIAIENMQDSNSNRSNSLKAFYARITELCALEFFSSSDKLYAEPAIHGPLMRGMSLKKRHEVNKIKDWNEHLALPYRSFVDIGSGKGHLCANLIAHQGRGLCLDRDERLQALGHKKLSTYTPDIEKRLRFQKLELLGAQSLPIDGDFNKALALGLHGCGDLSVDILKSALVSELDVLSFGCCYHKCANINLSKRAKTRPIKLSLHALNLANRSNKPLSRDTYTKRFQVKRYRYIAHLLSLEILGKGLGPLGNASPSDYLGDFESYVKKYCPQLLNEISSAKLQQSYQMKLKSKTLKRLLNFEAIRSPLGIVVEAYLLLDRALWLQENDRIVEVKRFFDRNLSPRNIGIYAKVPS